jgi:hypothetical protein
VFGVVLLLILCAGLQIELDHRAAERVLLRKFTRWLQMLRWL